MRKTKILVVDDDPAICRLLQQALAQNGTEVIVAGSSKDCLRIFHAERPNLVLLDVMLPEGSGFEVCRRLREFSDVPVIMVSAMGLESDIVRGFESGADDYIVKPFQLSVLRARIDSALRRAALAPSSKETAGYRDDYLIVDLVQRRVMVDGQLVQLTPTEFKLLACLVEQPGRLVTYREILHHVWGWEYDDQVNYVHVYMVRLRHKIERDPYDPHYLLTEARVGYRFEPKRTGIR